MPEAVGTELGDRPRESEIRVSAPRPLVDVLDAEIGAELSTRLGADEQRRLGELMEDAIERQRLALDDAIDNGLRAVPRVLRGPVRRLLFR